MSWIGVCGEVKVIVQKQITVCGIIDRKTMYGEIRVRGGVGHELFPRYSLGPDIMPA
jgi:hypothetical protein